MAWKTMDVQERRVRFVVEATQKRRPFGALCVAYEISRPTGYLWLQRYREQGVAGIAERSRKPHAGGPDNFVGDSYFSRLQTSRPDDVLISAGRS
jgi:hypothetical protein